MCVLTTVGAACEDWIEDKKFIITQQHLISRAMKKPSMVYQPQGGSVGKVVCLEHTVPDERFIFYLLYNT